MNMKKWVAEAINQAEIIDAVAEKLAEKFESEEQEWPPYGVPAEVSDGNGRWFTRVSAGDGFYFYDGSDKLCSFRAWPKWRYKPVDWKRADDKLNSRIILSRGNIEWYHDRADSLVVGYQWSPSVTVLHIDRRPV